jgi:hypothetical protein
MDCMPRSHRDERFQDAVPEPDPCALLARRVRNRQAAVLYLRAASTVSDAGSRERLRRRAAGLISGS